MGAGLGGGSADAAFVVKGLSELFGLNLSRKCMEELCACIGSDTAFFVANRPALAAGRGEILEPVDFSLRGKRLLIVKPAESVSTAEAYAGIAPRRTDRPLFECLNAPVDRWRETVRNDFEPVVFRAHPQLERLRNEMYRRGAVYASMTGSGAAVYGIFRRRRPDRFRFRKCVCLSGRYGLIARRVGRADFRIWQKKRKFASGYVSTAFET